jgi:hypothetical protein
METPAVQTPVRKRVSQACQTCEPRDICMAVPLANKQPGAAKKVKCDGLNNGPGGRCGPCSLRNEPECIYGVSKRRLVGLAALRKAEKSLEHFTDGYHDTEEPISIRRPVRPFLKPTHRMRQPALPNRTAMAQLPITLNDVLLARPSPYP